MHTHTNTDTHMNTYLVRYRVRFARPSGWVRVLGTAVRGVRLLVEVVGACVLGTLSRSFCSTVRLGACDGDGCQGCAFACRSCWGMCTWYAIAFVLLDRQAGCVCWGRLSVSVSCGRQRNANVMGKIPIPDGRAVG